MNWRDLLQSKCKPESQWFVRKGEIVRAGVEAKRWMFYGISRESGISHKGTICQTYVRARVDAVMINFQPWMIFWRFVLQIVSEVISSNTTRCIVVDDRWEITIISNWCLPEYKRKYMIRKVKRLLKRWRIRCQYGRTSSRGARLGSMESTTCMLVCWFVGRYSFVPI